jgi:hypothetical protein
MENKKKKKAVKKDQSMVDLYKHLIRDGNQVTSEGIYLGDDMYLLPNGKII